MAEGSGNGPLLAVLTGDIVRSTALSRAELDAVMADIGNSAVIFETLYPGSIIGRPDAYRGDSWQIAMAVPRLSLRLAMYLRAGVIGGGLADTRISIGMGSGNALVRERVSQSTGAAFLSSGRGLDGIGGRHMALAMPDAPSDTGALAGSVALLLDYVAACWTPKQAGAARRVLENPGKPDADIAGARMSDSERRNFTKLRNRANVDRILDVLSAFEGLAFWAGSA